MTAPGPERYCGRALKVAAFVALVGPLLGAAFISAIIMWRAIAEAALDPTSWSAVRDAGSVVMLVVVFAYILAVVPSVLTAAVLGWRAYTHGTFAYGMALAVAGIATFAGTAVFDLLIHEPDKSFLGLAMFLLPFALLSAVLGRWLMARLGILPNLSKS